MQRFDPGTSVMQDCEADHYTTAGRKNGLSDIKRKIILKEITVHAYGCTIRIYSYITDNKLRILFEVAC